VLGYFAAITLVLTVLSPLILDDVFAESFTVNFDKPVYNDGDSITISGEILEFGMPVIAMSIYDPDGKILSANNLEISSEKTFSKSFVLDSPFYKKSGEYTVKINYGKISENYFFTIDGSDFEPEIIIETFEEPEIILLYTEKKQYTDNDIIKITGLVSALDSPSVLIGIYDPFGMPGGFYFGSVDSNLEFSTSFLVKSGVNFRVDGTYSVKAHYGETEAVLFFDYYKNPQDIIEDTIPNTEEEIPEPSNPSPETSDDVTPEPSNPSPETSDDVTPEPSNPSPETSDDVTPEPSNPSPEKIDSENNDSDVSKTNNSQSNTDTRIKTVSENIPSHETNDSEIIKTKIIDEKNTPNNINDKKEIKKLDNLSVEDIELGIILNQINLQCDSSILIDTISYYDGMGPALYRLCKFDSSLNFFNESLIKNPNDVEVLTNKGSTLGKLGHLSEAIMYYDQAIKIDPDFLPAKNNKANALANMRNYDDAVLLYNDILEKSPNYMTARKNLDIVLSLNMDGTDLVHTPTDSDIGNIIYAESSMSEKTIQTNQKIQESIDFINKINLAFSTLGSLFGFLN